MVGELSQFHAKLVRRLRGPRGTVHRFCGLPVRYVRRIAIIVYCVLWAIFRSLSVGAFIPVMFTHMVSAECALTHWCEMPLAVYMTLEPGQYPKPLVSAYFVGSEAYRPRVSPRVYDIAFRNRTPTFSVAYGVRVTRHGDLRVGSRLYRDWPMIAPKLMHSGVWGRPFDCDEQVFRGVYGDVVATLYTEVHGLFGHWQHDGLCWLCRLPNALVARSVFLVDRSRPAFVDETLAWFRWRGVVVLGPGEFVIGERVYKMRPYPWQEMYPAMLWRYREWAWERAGADRVVASRYVLLNRPRTANRHIVNMEDVHRRFVAALPSYAWEQETAGPLRFREFVRRFRTLRFLLTIEGSNCSPTMYMESRSIFVEVKCDFSGHYWWNVTRCLQQHYVQMRIPAMQHTARNGTSNGVIDDAHAIGIVRRVGEILAEEGH